MPIENEDDGGNESVDAEAWWASEGDGGIAEGTENGNPLPVEQVMDKITVLANANTGDQVTFTITEEAGANSVGVGFITVSGAAYPINIGPVPSFDWSMFPGGSPGVWSLTQVVEFIRFRKR